jgi:perosamine synthetase
MNDNDFIPFFRPLIGDEEINDVNQCLRSGWLTTGRYAKQFEQDFADYMGRTQAVAVNSCTAALHLALEAVGIKPGDLVLVPTYTFAATAEVVRYMDAIPVLVDMNDSDFNMDMQKTEQILKDIALGKKVKGVPEKHNGVKAIIPVHFGGQAVDVAYCRKLCDEFNLLLIEDCAHCCPAYYKDNDGTWKMTGSSADIACYSFYANKTITTGEGGMALTNNEEWADRMRIMSLHGISKDAWKRFSREGSWFYEITAPGFKYNMTDIAAAIGVNQLKRADSFHLSRKTIAEYYTKKLSDIKGLRLPIENDNIKHSWHLYIIRIDEHLAGISRNDFIKKMTKAGIGCSVHYIPLHIHPYYKENFSYEDKDFPIAYQTYTQAVSLPIYPDLKDFELKRITDTVCKILNK